MGQERKASAGDAADFPSRKRAFSYYQLIASPLRDVLPDIFGYLAASRGDLFSATLVCRDWAVAAGAVLWRSVPTYAFDYVASDRGQQYANRVCCLEESKDPRQPAASPMSMMGQQQQRPSTNASHCLSPFALMFPQLRKLTLRRHCRCWQAVDAASRASYLDGFVMSRPERLECDSVDLTSGVLTARLAGVRPPLRELRVHATDYSPGSLTFRLPTLPQFGPDTLEVFKLDGHAMLSSDALADLVHRTALRRLSFAPIYGHCHVDGSTVWRAFSEPRHFINTEAVLHPTFRSLESLRATADWEAVRLLLKAMPPPSLSSLREINITHAYATGAASFAVFASVSHQLQVLRLRLSAKDVLQGADILSAVQQPVSLLRELSLLSYDAEALAIVGFDDTQFAALAAALPQLEVLRLQGSGSITSAAFRIVGVCCRALRELELHHRLEIGPLVGAHSDASAVLFPELRKIELTSPESFEPYWPLRIDHLHRNW
jgi:hypothetical protein